MQEASAFSTSFNFLLFCHPTRDFLESLHNVINCRESPLLIVFKRNARMLWWTRGNLLHAQHSISRGILHSGWGRALLVRCVRCAESNVQPVCFDNRLRDGEKKCRTEKSTVHQESSKFCSVSIHVTLIQQWWVYVCSCDRRQYSEEHIFKGSELTSRLHGLNVHVCVNIWNESLIWIKNFHASMSNGGFQSDLTFKERNLNCWLFQTFFSDLSSLFGVDLVTVNTVQSYCDDFFSPNWTHVSNALLNIGAVRSSDPVSSFQRKSGDIVER